MDITNNPVVSGLLMIGLKAGQQPILKLRE